MNSDDSGFEEDCDNNIYIEPGKSSSSSSQSLKPERPKEEIIPPIPLVQSGISLEPDMLFGWRPKSLLHGGPIPLNFTMDNIPTKSSIFYGYRPEDSLELHETYSGPYTYSYTINSTVKQAYKIIKKKIPKKDCRPFIGMKNDLEGEELVFDSKFESGNLDKVTKVKEDEYDLYIRSDSNTYGKNQWFYFSVTNNGQEREYKFNIVNFSKQNSLFTQGQQPCVYRESVPSKGWHFIGDNIKYTLSKINKTIINKRIFYCLSFTFIFPGSELIRLAYSIPYTYSDLCGFLKYIQISPYIKRDSLCKSLSGVDVPMITVTDEESLENKENIIVTARVHPGETNGSWVMQGFLKFLIGESQVAYRLRKIFVFKIVPMLNPDGVIAGNSRCSLNGQDLNRQFQIPDIRLHPEIYHIKNLIYNTKDILTYLDFHSHSKKKGMFIYGPHFPLHSEYHCKIRVIPKLISENTEIFRYYSCKFRNDWSKRKAARLVVSREHHLPYCYTIETSSYAYIDSERNTVQFDVYNLQSAGEYILTSLLQYVDLQNDEIRLKEARAEMRHKKSLRGSPVKDCEKKRTMEDILDQIKNDLKNEDDSDSGGSNSDPEKEREEEKVSQNILNIFKQVDQLFESPVSIKRYSHSQAAKMPKIGKKPEEFEIQAKSTLAKYFSRASTDNKAKFKYRTESVKRAAVDLEKKMNQKPTPKPKEMVSKFSYSRGLHALKPKAAQMMLEKSVLKNKKPVIKPEHKEVNNINLGFFLECLDEGYESSEESIKKELGISVIMRKNSKYQSADKINF
jgi:cytosolic carboxypeptidase protein 2/3